MSILFLWHLSNTLLDRFFTFCSSVFRHLDCFYFLAIVNNVSMNFLVQFFFLINIGILFLLVIYLRIELLDHVFTFVKKFRAVSQSDCNFCIPTSFVRRVPVSPHRCLYLLLYVLFSIIITLCEVLSHHYFNLHFPKD